MSAPASARELGATGQIVETMIPRRLDRLPWSRWHWLVVFGLGITWILDGFEVTVVGAIASMLTHPDALGLSEQQAASAGTFYLVGAVFGALFFGYLTDRFGRKKLFTITLAVYLIFTVASALAWDYWSFVTFRLLAGAGIGGEYSAINSAIDELIPARVRGRVAIAINGSWWVGTALAAFLSYELLTNLDEAIGWRLGFFLGAILALAIIMIRRFIPESPRWLLTHGRPEEAERVVTHIEERVRKQHPVLPEPEGEPIVIQLRERLNFVDIAKYVIRNYPKRGVLGLALMTGQAFLYNAIFFTYTLVLTRFYGVPAETAPLYLIPFAVGNFLGPLVLGPLFDIVGRRTMIPFTYITSGLLLIVTGQLFVHEVLTHDLLLVRDLLLRLGGRKLGVSHGQRVLPAGSPRDGDRTLLFHRDRPGGDLADDLRRPDREREPNERQLRIPRRSERDDRRRGDRRLPRRPGRAEGARGRRVAVHRRPREGAVGDCSARLGWRHGLAARPA